MKRILVYGVAMFLLSGWVPEARSDIVNHGNFLCHELDYLDVTEVTPSSELFFGSPGQSQNALVFNTTLSDGSSLTSTSRSTSGGFDFTNGALGMVLSAKPGFLMDGVRIRHFGSISTIGLNSMAMIGSVGFVTSGTDVFSGSFSVESHGNQLNGLFDESYTIRFPATETAVLSIQDQLFTQADQGPGAAFVNTQGVVIETFSVSSIPEPGLGLACGLLPALLLIRRRRQQI